VSAADQSVASAVGGSDFASFLVGMAANPNGANPEQNIYPNFTKDIPRLAFSYQPLSHLVLRGGAGFYYGPSTHNVQTAGNNTDGLPPAPPGMAPASTQTAILSSTARVAEPLWAVRSMTSLFLILRATNTINTPRQFQFGARFML